LLMSCLLVGINSEPCPYYPSPVSLPKPIPLALLNVLSEIDYFLKTQLTQLQLPGLVISIVYDQEIISSKGYGFNNPFNTSQGPPSIDSGIRIASITKVFTDIMLMNLRDDGLVSLDDPVVKYIPSFSVKNPYSTKRPITLRQLASHTSGLQREVPCDWPMLAVCTESEILANLSKTYLHLFWIHSTTAFSQISFSGSSNGSCLKSFIINSSLSSELALSYNSCELIGSATLSSVP